MIAQFFRKDRFILLSILILGLLLRILYGIPWLYGDELTITLDAYSLLKTGHDQLGNFLPLTFPMGAGRPAGYVYGSIPFIAVFGPTALGVRMLSVLSGLGIIVLIYLIVKKAFGNKTGFLAAVITAVSPWDISLSRGGFEAHFALFLALLGTYLFMIARQKPLMYILAALSFGLTLHTYPTYKFSLLLFLPLLCWFRGYKTIILTGKKHLIGAALILIVLGSLALSQTLFGGSEARFSNINIFAQRELKAVVEQKINVERQSSQLPKTLLKFFHNKPVEYTKVFIGNYLKNFSLDFLVLHGDRNPRHNMATMGGLYVIETVLIAIAFLSFWQKDRRRILFLVLWIILAPIPTAIVDLPHALRSSFMLPPLVILSALGLAAILKLRSKIPLFLIALFFTIQFIFFIQKSYFLAPYQYSNFWSYSAKAATEITADNRNQYDYVILSNRIDDIEYAFPVYSKIDPELIISQNTKKTMLGNSSLKKFDNVFIGSTPQDDLMQFISNLPGSVLYIGSRHEKDNLQNYEIVTDFNNEQILIIKRKP